MCIVGSRGGQGKRLDDPAPRIIAADVRALHRPGRQPVPARHAVAVRRASRAVRHRRLRLGRQLAGRRRPARLVPRRPGVPRRSGPRRGRLDRDDRRARPPAAPVAPVDADAARHAAVRRPGRPVLVQPQRRPARLPIAAGDLSRAGPDPRPRRHGGRALAGWRTPGGPTSRPPTCWPPSTTGSAARPTWPSSPPTARRTTTRAMARTRSSPSGWGASGSCRPASTRSIDRSSGSSPRAPPTGGSWPCARRVALGPDGTPLAVA